MLDVKVEQEITRVVQGHPELGSYEETVKVTGFYGTMIITETFREGNRRRFFDKDTGIEIGIPSGWGRAYLRV